MLALGNTQHMFNDPSAMTDYKGKHDVDSIYDGHDGYNGYDDDGDDYKGSGGVMYGDDDDFQDEYDDDDDDYKGSGRGSDMYDDDGYDEVVEDRGMHGHGHHKGMRGLLVAFLTIVASVVIFKVLPSVRVALIVMLGAALVNFLAPRGDVAALVAPAHLAAAVYVLAFMLGTYGKLSVGASRVTAVCLLSVLSMCVVMVDKHHRKERNQDKPY